MSRAAVPWLNVAASSAFSRAADSKLGFRYYRMYRGPGSAAGLTKESVFSQATKAAR